MRAPALWTALVALASVAACNAILGDTGPVTLLDAGAGGGGGDGAADGPARGGDAGLHDASCPADATGGDPKNCGYCGHDCQGGACVSGACQPALLASSSHPWALGVGDKTLYWTRQVDNEVDRCALPACASPELAGSCDVPEGLAVTPGGYFFACNGAAEVFACPIAGCKGPAAMVKWAPAGIAVFGGSMYWTSQEDMNDDPHSGAVQTAYYDGGGVTTLATNLGTPTGVAVNADQLFWTEAMTGTLATCMLSSCDTKHGSTLASNLQNPDQIALDSKYAYVTVNGTSPNFTDGMVLAVALDGSSVTTLASGRSYPRGIVVDDAFVYFVDYIGPGTTTGTVRRVPVGGGDVVVLATNQHEPIGMAQDSAAIYWGNYGDGTLFRLAK